MIVFECIYWKRISLTKKAAVWIVKVNRNNHTNVFVLGGEKNQKLNDHNKSLNKQSCAYLVY